MYISFCLIAGQCSFRVEWVGLARSQRGARARVADLVMRRRRTSRPHASSSYGAPRTRPRTAAHPSLVAAEASRQPYRNPFRQFNDPAIEIRTLTRVSSNEQPDKKNETKNIPANGKCVLDRDNYISAVHSSSVRSTTKNTDAIFTAYVIEH